MSDLIPISGTRVYSEDIDFVKHRSIDVLATCMNKFMYPGDNDRREFPISELRFIDVRSHILHYFVYCCCEPNCEELPKPTSQDIVELQVDGK